MKTLMCAARLACSLAVGVVGGGALAPAASATVVLDQANFIQDAQYFGVGVGTLPAFMTIPTRHANVAQTLTVGASGYLDHIDLQLLNGSREAGLVSVALYWGDLGIGPATLIGSLAFAGSLVPVSDPKTNYLTGNVRAANLYVTSGEALTLSVDFWPADGMGNLSWVMGHFVSFNPFQPDFSQYANGTAYGYDNLRGAWTPLPGDTGFRTYVDLAPPPPPRVPAVPEPGSWALMLSGFAAIGTALRTRSVRRWGKGMDVAWKFRD